MSVVEETREETVVEIEPNQIQKDLDQMIEWVKNDLWCRNNVLNDAGQMCAYGMLARAVEGDVFSYSNKLDEALRLLDQAIDVYPSESVYGGNHYGFEGEETRVTTYNNCAKDEQQIIDWFERAKLLA